MPARPPLRLRAEAEQRQEAAPRPAGEQRALRVDDALGDQGVVDGADVLELGQPGPAARGRRARREP